MSSTLLHQQRSAAAAIVSIQILGEINHPWHSGSNMIRLQSIFVSSPDFEQKTFKAVGILPRVEERTAKASVPDFILHSF